MRVEGGDIDWIQGLGLILYANVFPFPLMPKIKQDQVPSFFEFNTLLVFLSSKYCPYTDNTTIFHLYVGPLS